VPYAPTPNCLIPTCPHRATSHGRCRDHAKEYAHACYQRKAGHLYDREWKRESKAFLLEHQHCADCDQPSTVVDHTEPHHGDRVKFWDRRLWQALCKPCHDSKTATIDGGFGRNVKQRNGLREPTSWG
jgi:5-methylcytosine-specific restriction enzyme A